MKDLDSKLKKLQKLVSNSSNTRVMIKRDKGIGGVYLSGIAPQVKKTSSCFHLPLTDIKFKKRYIILESSEFVLGSVPILLLQFESHKYYFTISRIKLSAIWFRRQHFRYYLYCYNERIYGVLLKNLKTLNGSRYFLQYKDGTLQTTSHRETFKKFLRYEMIKDTLHKLETIQS